MRQYTFPDSDEVALPAEHRALKTIFFGGLTVGILDGLFALVFYSWILGAQTLRIFQGVATGVLGKASFDGGIQTFLLGIALHFLVAASITTVYYLASLKIPILIRQPFLCGPIYGIVAFFGMNYIVVPLSYAGGGGGKLSLLDLVAIIGHMVLVGLPIALITRRFAKE